MQSKHPAANPSASAWSAGSDLELEGGEPVLISFDNVVSLIHSSSKGASPGVDNFPVDILKQLAKTAVKKEFPVDTRLFLDLLTNCFNLVLPGVLPGVTSLQIPSSPLSHISSALVVIAPLSVAVASQETRDNCELLSNSAAMEVESGVNLDIDDIEFIQSLTSSSVPIITEPNSYFAGGAYLQADEVDDYFHQCDQAIERKGRIVINFDFGTTFSRPTLRSFWCRNFHFSIFNSYHRE